MPLAAGTRLGVYQVSSALGAGGMGEVFRARDTRLGREVAIKILPAAFATDDDRLRRFEQEACAAAALNHPNILVVYDVGSDNGVSYVVSELLEGQTLRQVLDRGALPTRKAVEYAVQAANGLAAAHEKHIIHRDLKPENLFVTKDGRIKILDFGLAKLVETVGADGSLATLAQTDPGLVVGTMGYISPEQLRAEPVSARSDVFSLGAVLYEMCTGERAFKGKTAVDTISAILKEDPPDFPPSVHAGSPAIERIVRRCLDKNPEERFQSARDVTFALDAISTSSGMKPQPDVTEKGRSRLGLSHAAAIAAALAFGGAMYVAGGRFGSRPAEAPSVTQLTFRPGTVRGARFGPDGQTIFYAAAWEGEPIKLFSMRTGNSQSTELSVAPSDLFAMSATGDLALGVNATLEPPFYTRGILARAPISGGAPRELLERVSSADFNADGSQLAAIRDDGLVWRVEYPLGTLRAKEAYWLSDVRVSPDEKEVAFIAHPFGGDEGEIRIVNQSGAVRTISKGWLSIQGLHWVRGGQELWFTGSRTGLLRSLWAVTPEGRERIVYRAPVRLQLQDVSPDGRVLVSGGKLDTQVRFGALHGTAETNLSWFDWAGSLNLSSDGRLLSFIESGEGAGTKYRAFVRPTTGGPAVHLADGIAARLSPDGKAVAVLAQDANMLQIVPTGPSEGRTCDLRRFEFVSYFDWYPDNRRLAVVASEPRHEQRTYEVDTSSGAITPITAEGIAGQVTRFIAPSGDAMLVWNNVKREASLLDLHTQTMTPVKGIQFNDVVTGWTPDSSAVFVGDIRDTLGRLFRLELKSGNRTIVRTFNPSDSAGALAVTHRALAADGEHYVYAVQREISQLFVIAINP